MNGTLRKNTFKYISVLDLVRLILAVCCAAYVTLRKQFHDVPYSVYGMLLRVWPVGLHYHHQYVGHDCLLVVLAKLLALFVVDCFGGGG